MLNALEKTLFQVALAQTAKSKDPEIRRLHSKLSLYVQSYKNRAELVKARYSPLNPAMGTLAEIENLVSTIFKRLADLKAQRIDRWLKYGGSLVGFVGLAILILKYYTHQP